ncbi:MAG: lipoprotein [Woeseiaceae bacterium]
MTRRTLIPAAVLLFFLIAGCGQSGPLYLPGNPSQIRTSPPEPEQSEAEEEQDRESDAG